MFFFYVLTFIFFTIFFPALRAAFPRSLPGRTADDGAELLAAPDTEYCFSALFYRQGDL